VLFFTDGKTGEEFYGCLKLVRWGEGEPRASIDFVSTLDEAGKRPFQDESQAVTLGQRMVETHSGWTFRVLHPR
jgi:hypothetical protein